MIIVGDIAMLPDRSRYAGSIQPLDRMIGNVVRHAGVPIHDAVRMATLTPASVIGLQREIGSIEPGNARTSASWTAPSACSGPSAAVRRSTRPARLRGSPQPAPHPLSAPLVSPPMTRFCATRYTISSGIIPMR